MSSPTLNERRFSDWKFKIENRQICSKCSAGIIWMKTEIGQNIAVNPIRTCILNITGDKKHLLDPMGVIHDHTSKAKVLGWQIHLDTCQEKK